MERSHFDEQIIRASERFTELARRNELTMAQHPEMQEALEELATALEELHVAGEELTVQNEALITAREKADQDRQRY